MCEYQSSLIEHDVEDLYVAVLISLILVALSDDSTLLWIILDQMSDKVIGIPREHFQRPRDCLMPFVIAASISLREIGFSEAR